MKLSLVPRAFGWAIVGGLLGNGFALAFAVPLRGNQVDPAAPVALADPRAPDADGVLRLDADLPAEQPSALAIRDCDELLSESARLNRALKLSFIRDQSVEKAIGHAPRDDRDFEQAAERYLLANRAALGLGVGDGRLRHVRTRGTDSGITLVSYEQEARLQDGSYAPVFDTDVTAIFDGSGRLTQIKNVTADDIDGLSAARLSEAVLARIAERDIGGVELDVLDDGPFDGADAPNAHSEWVPFQVLSVSLLGLGVYGQDEGLLPTLAVRFYVQGRLFGRFEGQPHAEIAYLSAADGRVLRVQPAHVGFAPQNPNPYTATGSAQMYDPNPIENPTPLIANIYRLDSNFHNLYGQYTNVHNLTTGDATDPNYQFHYYGAPYPLDSHMLEASAYYGINRAKVYLEKLAFPSLMNFSIYADAVCTAISSGFDPGTNSLCYIANDDSAFDQDVVPHEYRHAVQQAIFGINLNTFSVAPIAAVLEGDADSVATSQNNDPEFAEGVAQHVSWPYLRTLNSSYNMTYNYSGQLANKYSDGIIWGASFWDLNSKLGKRLATRIATQALYHLALTDTFYTALDTAVIPAIYDLYPASEAAQVEQIVRKTFALHAIYLPGQNPWNGTTFPRPYLDNTDITQTYTVPGASAVTLTFDAYTRAYQPYTGNTDLVYVTDANDVNIAGSPFTGWQLANATKTVPGDTVKVRLYSIPGNARSSSGPGSVLNVVADDPNNQLPVINAAISSTSGMDPMRIKVDLRGCTDPDGSVIAYTVNFGDGSWDHNLDASYPVVEHIYNRDGVGPIVQAKDFNLTVTITDDKGGVQTSVTQVHVEPYNDLLAPVAYCTAGTTTNGCTPSVSATRNPDVSHQTSCVISVAGVEGQQNGLLFYGVSGRNASPWGPSSTSFLCVKTPFERANVQSSGGTAGQCDGSLSLDWTAWQVAHPSALGQPWATGANACVQAWFRDPPAPRTTNLSNALELTYLP